MSSRNRFRSYYRSLLFGIALSTNRWYKQYTIAYVIIATTVFRFLFYSLTVMAALVSPACPFQTPISTMLRIDSEITSVKTAGVLPNGQIGLPVSSAADDAGARYATNVAWCDRVELDPII
ncbi:hypothetical protein EDB19DRAFT_1904356 [Suillus lakei]|nr:hypothetical protein EDB19DRAFT_1904356 [Suillus lakei]